MSDISDAFRRVIDTALAQAVQDAQGGEPFLAFAVLEEGDSTTMHRFMSERFEDSAKDAEAYVLERNDLTRAAIGMDGYMHHEGRRWDAVVIRGFDAVEGVRTVIAQRYERVGLIRKQIRLVGTPIFAG